MSRFYGSAIPEHAGAEWVWFGGQTELLYKSLRYDADTPYMCTEHVPTGCIIISLRFHQHQAFLGMRLHGQPPQKL